MMTLKPTFLMQSLAAPSNCVQAARLERLPTFSHSHVLSFRSLLLDMQVYSPCVKLVKQPGLEIPQPRPVFGDQGRIEGKITLDPSCSQLGRLTIFLEGAFEYLCSKDNEDDEDPHNPTVRRHRYVFLSSSVVVPLAPISDSRSTIRDALSVRKRPSVSSPNRPACRSCEFSFEIPCGTRFGEELPATFSFAAPAGDSRKQSTMEELEVSYRIMAVWEACDGSGKQAILETPVLFQPDADFQSVDGSVVEPQSWLEMPLMAERPIPFNCAVTLPRPQSFLRCSSIPYFVVFTTNTRSPCLVREIAADATVVVSLVRKITISPQHSPPTLPDTPPPGDESDSQASPRTRLLKRPTKAPARLCTQDEFFCAKKPSRAAFSVTRTLETQVSVGFPKRPRSNDMSQNLPDGLYKGKVRLPKDILPSVDWPGISVKYYLDVSVLVGQDTVRARVPVRVH